MKKLFALFIAFLAPVAFMMPAGPAAAGPRYSIATIEMANTQANPQAIAADPVTGTLYVGQQDGADGAQIAVLSPSGSPRAFIRVGDSYDAASNVPPDGERPAPHAPSRVIALAINSLKRTVIALVTDSWINASPTYAGLSGSYIVAVDMRTNTVSRKYTVAAPAPDADAAAEGWHDVRTMWTGMALDPIANVVWGVEGYDPTASDAVDRLNLTTGIHERASLPVVTNDAPIDAVPSIAFNLVTRHGYVGVAGTVFVIDSTLRVVNRLRVPGSPGCDLLPGTAPTATVSSPWSATIYMTWCGSIYQIDGATYSVTQPFPTIPLGPAGLALNPLTRTLFVSETRDDVSGLGVYSTVKPSVHAFVPLGVSGMGTRRGNAWIAINPVLGRTYVACTSSTICEVIVH